VALAGRGAYSAVAGGGTCAGVVVAVMAAMANDEERGLESIWRSFMDEMGLLATADGAEEVVWRDFCCRSRSVRPRDGAPCKRDPMSILDHARCVGRRPSSPASWALVEGKSSERGQFSKASKQVVGQTRKKAHSSLAAALPCHPITLRPSSVTPSRTPFTPSHALTPHTRFMAFVRYMHSYGNTDSRVR
jgi:hypothetical protein